MRGAGTRAKKAGFPYAFEGVLEELAIGRDPSNAMRCWGVFLPAALQKRAPFSAKKKLRMRGVVGGASGKPVSLAWQVSNGRHDVMFGRGAAKSLGLALGETVELAFDLVSEHDVDLPDELREALDQEPTWKELWSALTPGKQRGLAHMVRTLKNPDLRAQRAVDLLRGLEDGIVPGPPKRARS